jgi:hypothetical protein
VQLCDPPDDGFLETETYVGAFFKRFLNDFKETLYWVFLNEVYLVGGETLIGNNASRILKLYLNFT